MVVPVDPEVDEAERVGAEDRSERTRRVPVHALGRAELQHHDRNDDGDDAIAEGFEPGFAHVSMISFGCMRALLVVLCAMSMAVTGSAQWIKQPTVGVARLPDGAVDPD